MARNKEQSMAIEDRLMRRNPDDIIYIGGVMDGFLDTEAGKLMLALLNGRIAQEAKSKDVNNVPADRRLGRIEMCQTLIDDIDQFVVDRNKMLFEIKKPKPSKETQDGPDYEPAESRL